jgi:NAD-dependent dihydropyrimidine dehydrogenase PreA subunit
VYFITSLLPGLTEFIFMRDEVSPTLMKLAAIQDELFKEQHSLVQKNYDSMVPFMKSKMPVFGRTIPVEKFVETKEEVVLPFQEVSKIIDTKEIIGVGNCFCRHAKDLLGHNCKRTDLRKTCFSFGEHAKFLIEQGFIKQITREEAKKILKDCEEAGLVHKAFARETDKHIDREVIGGMCNCCSDCCEMIGGHFKGGVPIVDLVEYMAQVNGEECVGCGTCVEKCNLSIIELVDDIAVVEQDKCFGCGACANACPTGAMSLIKTELRRIFTPPPKLEST